MKNKYKVEGIHCPSCEILIEEKLEKEDGISGVKVNLAKKEVEIESESEVDLKELNKFFKKSGYKFLELNGKIEEKKENKNWILITLGIIAGFLLLNKLGLASFLKINNQSSLLTFFIFGIIAGFSSCGALLSGIIMSYPKRTLEILIGRIVSYTILGAILGVIGQAIFRTGLVNWLVIIVSTVMIIVALQMLQIKWAQRIKIALPKVITKKIVTKKLPIIIGLLTVFLPCGFTLLAESAAMISGGWIKGLEIMLMFVLGSSIPLFLIGLSSEKLFKNQRMMGLLILFFMLFNLNLQFGWTNYFKSSFNKNETSKTNNQPAEIVKASYTRFGGIDPNPIVVKVGQRVRIELEIKESETGCMATIMLPKLFPQIQTLVKGKTLIMEFTPDKVGTYQFTCAMGLPHQGVVNVIK